MTTRWTQVKKLDSVTEFRAHCDRLGIEIPIDDSVDPDGPLARPVDIVAGGGRVLRSANRFAVLPMEGWDGTTDGGSTDLVRRRWKRFGESGAAWCGERRPRFAPTAVRTPTSS